jgi:hypothetical protein
MTAGGMTVSIVLVTVSRVNVRSERMRRRRVAVAGAITEEAVAADKAVHRATSHAKCGAIASAEMRAVWMPVAAIVATVVETRNVAVASVAAMRMRPWERSSCRSCCSWGGVT